MEEGLYSFLILLFLLIAPPDGNGRNSSSGDGIAQNTPAQEETVSPALLPANQQQNSSPPVEITAPTSGNTPSNAGGNGDPTTAGGNGDPTAAGGNGDPTAAGGNGDPTTAGGNGDPTSTAGGSSEEQGGATTSQSPSGAAAASSADGTVPTPAMLPSLLGFSASMLKKKQKQASLPEQPAASA